MERHDFDAFGQVIAVAIETGIRDGIKAGLLAVKADEQALQASIVSAQPVSDR